MFVPLITESAVESAQVQGIFESQLAIHFTLQYLFTADFWEILPNAILTILSRNSRKSARYSIYYIKSQYSWLLRNCTNQDRQCRRKCPISKNSWALACSKFLKSQLWSYLISTFGIERLLRLFVAASKLKEFMSSRLFKISQKSAVELFN